jgi:hypothetical protein
MGSGGRTGTRTRGQIRSGRFIERAEDWIVHFLPGLGIEDQVTHEVVADGKNAMVVDHLIPEGPRGDQVAFRVTTRHRELPSNHFPDRHVRQEVSEASLERGRAIYCIRRDIDEVVAAISYHLEDQGPLSIRAMALRQDADRPDIWAESRWALVVCKAYLHVFAEKKMRRTADLLYDADTKAKIAEAQDFLGFRRAARQPGLRPSGRALLVQPKLGR